MKVTINKWEGRRILLPCDAQVAVGIVTSDDETKRTALMFHRAGEETVRFALSDEARDALVRLLTDPTAGEEWTPPIDMESALTFEWKYIPLEMDDPEIPAS